VNTDDFFFGHGHEPIREIFAQVFLGRKRKAPDVVERFDLIRRDPMGFEHPPVGFGFRGLPQSLFQAVKLQAPQIATGDGFNLFFPEHEGLL